MRADFTRYCLACLACMLVGALAVIICISLGLLP